MINDIEATEACAYLVDSYEFILSIRTVRAHLDNMSHDVQKFRKGRRRGYKALAILYLRAYVHAEVLKGYEDKVAKSRSDPPPADVVRALDALDGFTEASRQFADELRTHIELNWAHYRLR